MSSNLSERMQSLTKRMEVGRGSFKTVRQEKIGDVTPARTWTNRRPHPTNMNNYDKWCNDPEANIAFHVLTDLIAGVSYYTEMPEEVNPDHGNKTIVDKYGENVNLDEDLEEIVLTMLQKGFCPVERLDDYDLKILPPETFYIYQDKKGNVLKYTQEYYQGQIEAEWTDNEMENIIVFYHRKTTSWPYGKSLIEPIGSLIEERGQMNADMPAAIHRWAYPYVVWQTEGSKQALETQVTDRDVDEHIFIGNVREGEVRWEAVDVNPQARFIPYIELIYYQICEGLHAPLLLYLKNATEASATVMMESVDRLVNGLQRYVKRRVERYLFEPQCGPPVPRLMWGQPKTGLEDITLTDIASVFPYLADNQRMDLLQQFGIQLPEAETPPSPPQLPFLQQQKPLPNMELMLEKLHDLSASLLVIESNYEAKQITLPDAVRLGERVISTHLKRTIKNNDSYKMQHEREFEEWLKRLRKPYEQKKGRVFHVEVPDN